MAYNPLSISSAASTVPFANAKPLKYIWVSPTGKNTNNGSESSPFKTIQYAVDKAAPGTAVMVKAGTYRENVELKKDGTTTNPIWLTSADGVGSAKIVATNNNQSVLRGHGEDNWIIKGLTIEGGKNGIQFSQSGSNLSNLTKNIVIQENIIKNVKVDDGIKISQADNFSIVGNHIEGGVYEEGIDGVYVTDSIIAYNTIIKTNGLSGITIKAGSNNIDIHHNMIDGAKTDGIIVGGWSTGQGSIFPRGINYEARDVVVEYNEVHNVGKRGINVLAGQDSTIKNNLFDSNNSYPVTANIGGDNNGYISKNVTFSNNIFENTKFLSIEARQGAVYQNGNVKGGSWKHETGADDLPNGSSVSPPSSGGPSQPSQPTQPSTIGSWKESAKSTTTKKGGSGADNVKGTDGHDLIDGGSAADTMTGYKGDDTYVVGSRYDKVVEKAGEGTDTIILWDSIFRMPGNVENLRIEKKTGAEVWDNASNNLFFAGAGNDTFNLMKNNGHDAIKGFSVGKDHIHLDGVSASQVTTHVSGGNLILDLPGDHSVTLIGQTSSVSLNTLLS